MRATGFTTAIRVGDHPDPENDIFFGDNLAALEALRAADGTPGPVTLCYTDPPYNTGTAWEGPQFQAAYNDHWSADEDFYAFLAPRISGIRDLLGLEGSAYVHIDVRISPRVRLLMDEAFGVRCFRNQITRIKCNPKNFARRAYGSVCDIVCFYSRSPLGSSPDPMVWNDHRLGFSDEEIERLYPKRDASGRRYATTPLHAIGETVNGETGKPWRGLMPPRGKHWRRSPAELEEWDRQGRIEWSSKGNPREIIYADQTLGRRIQDLWEFKDPGIKRSRYPTEKPLEMLEMIIKQSSCPGDLVLDPFSGSGTTLAAAHRHGRRFLGMDQSPVSLAVLLERLGADEGASFRLHLQDGIALEDPGTAPASGSVSVRRDADTIAVELRDRPVPRVAFCAVVSRLGPAGLHLRPLRRIGEGSFHLGEGGGSEFLVVGSDGSRAVVSAT